MLYLILSAVGMGIMLSIFFIGPIFFLLIETSFSQGARHALVLDLGVVSADILCIVGACYASKEIIELINGYPAIYKITAFIILIYGLFLVFFKSKMHFRGESQLMTKNYLKTYFNGFLLNLLNIGVVLFWLITVISVRKQYPDFDSFILYLGIVMLTYLFVDFFKILLSKKFRDLLTPVIAKKIRRCVGGVLVLFSFFIFLQSFKKFNRLDRQLKEAENKHIIYKKK
ncbi:MAG: lysine transporter LysE [Bergeyella sp.]|nr:lysine transporter LysE [Bergeyella sp.]